MKSIFQPNSHVDFMPAEYEIHAPGGVSAQNADAERCL